jgi:hypothetical protein
VPDADDGDRRPSVARRSPLHAIAAALIRFALLAGVAIAGFLGHERARAREDGRAGRGVPELDPVIGC